MRHFKLPLIVTAITLSLAIVLGVAAILFISQSSGSRRQKQARAEMLGSGTATLACIVIAPFWIMAAAKAGKERRAAADAARRNPWQN